MSTSKTAHAATPRVVPGVPEGGQWTTFARSEPAVRLVDDRSSALAAIAARHDELAAGGFVPAVAVAATDDPGRTAGRQAWWDNHFATGEYRAGGGGYPQMPDDYTPSRTGGHAMSGDRRTHRMKYASDALTVRMPSATSIRRYSADEGARTFDVPVSAVFTDSDGTDRSVAGWVRVTRGGAGSWTATGMGFDDGADAHVAEAVAAVLESRRPSRALREVGDLIARRREREASAGAPLTPVDSSWISAVGYDEASGVMATQTVTGATYGHLVSRERFAVVAGSHSPGVQFNSLVKGKHPRAEVTQCEQCGRFASVTRSHMCPPMPAPPTVEEIRQNAAARRRAAEATGRIREVPIPSGVAASNAELAAVLAVRTPVHVLAPDDRSIDIDAMLEEQLGEREKRIGYFGPPGFTRGAIAGAIGPYTSSTYRPREYDEYGFGDQVYESRNGEVNPFRFAGLGGAHAEQLVGALTTRQMRERQNSSPTTGAILRAAATHPGSVEVSGYMVGPNREDERVVAEGVYLYDETITNAEQAWHALGSVYGVSDALAAPSYVREVENAWRPGERCWQLSWT